MKIKPTKKQLEFMDWEFGLFLHFGIRTFYEGHRDWDGKPMPLSGFNPGALDCENWILTAKEAGAKYAILVCKHHDGFANWQSEYSEYSVKNTPWKNGRGDVVREFTDACRKHGIKTGLYYSPAENGYKERTAKEYDDYFVNQIGELLTNYGKIDYLWFDGCGSEGHEYDKGRIISVIRGMQPEILIFNMWDPDVRWCGNETALASFDNSNMVSAVDFSILAETKDDLGQEHFLPAECNCMMRENNWFYSDSDEHTVKSLDELVGIYYQSVGRGGNLLINIGPDRRGLLPDKDAGRLIELGNEIKRRFSNPVQSEFSRTESGGIIKPKERALINHLVLGEDLGGGESVSEFRIYIKAPHVYNEVCIYAGKTIGRKRIIIFPAVNASEIIIKIIKSEGDFCLTKPEIYFV